MRLVLTMGQSRYLRSAGIQTALIRETSIGNADEPLVLDLVACDQATAKAAVEMALNGHDVGSTRARGECPRCGAKMMPGIALISTLTGVEDDVGGCVTLSAGGPGKIVDVLKCLECGHSVIPSFLAVPKKGEEGAE